MFGGEMHVLTDGQMGTRALWQDSTSMWAQIRMGTWTHSTKARRKGLQEGKWEGGERGSNFTSPTSKCCFKGVQNHFEPRRADVEPDRNKGNVHQHFSCELKGVQLWAEDALNSAFSWRNFHFSFGLKFPVGRLSFSAFGQLNLWPCTMESTKCS